MGARAVGMSVLVVLLLGLSPAGAQEAAWVPSMAPGSANFVSVSLLEGGVGYAFFGEADAPGSRLLRTDDGGVTYAPVTATTDFGPSAELHFVSADDGWATDGRSLHRSGDGGVTWSRVDGPQMPAGRGLVGYDGLDARADGTLALGMETSDGAPCGEEQGRRAELAVTPDGGATWDVHDLGLEGRVRDVDFPRADTGAVVVHGTRTTSQPTAGPLGLRAGCTTTFRDLPGTGAVLLLDGHGPAAAPRTVLACGPADCHQVARPTADRVVVGMGDGSVMVSEDAGATFSAVRLLPAEETAGLPVVITGIAFSDEATGTLSTAGHGLYRTVDGGGNWQQELAPRTGVGRGRGDLAVAPDGGALVAGPMGVLRRLPLDD